jgi:ATP-dependent RNA helicase HelY
MRERLARFWEGVPFPPDPFQTEAAEAIADGASVVVTAPTGSGKTLVAEAAVHLVVGERRRAFYTAPIKALSNQKYTDFAGVYGPEKVGLLTGDNVINPGAPLIIATLEVLRNMIYADPKQLDDVGLVVLDEAHYLQDPFRGAAWEEVIIHCPEHVRFVCLSATISNDAEFAAWVEEQRGRTELVSTDHRPVPLESMYMVRERSGAQTLHLLPTFVTRDSRRRPNPRIERLLSTERGRRRRFKTPNRMETVERLDDEGMLPAIYFIFSRAGCDAAAQRLVDSGVRLTTAEERSAIRRLAEKRISHLADDDLAVLDYDRWLTGLEAGVASHHAGHVPAFKETVEELFAMGIVKVVFATETLALGINMPARSVVLENLSKFNGESHQLLRAGDYTQLTGRAGRRGIDTQGFGIVLHSPFVSFDQVTEIASLGTHELRSSFRPTYNMTANLVANYREEQAENLLDASFAAFQRQERRQEADDRIEALEDQLRRVEEQARCDRGDVEEYLALLEAARPSRRQDGIKSLLGAGDVLDVVGGSRDGRYVVLKRLSSKAGGARYLVLSTSGRVSSLGYRQITDASTKTGTLELPAPLRPRDRRFIEDTLRRLRKVPPRRSDRSPRKHQLDHPVASCPDAEHHLSALSKANHVRRRITQYRAAQRTAGHGLVEEFTAIRALLEELHYLEGWSLTPRGERLRRIYNEMDLLMTESVERGLLYGLEAADLAALVSAFVYEPRTDKSPGVIWPTTELAGRWSGIEGLWEELSSRERRHRLAPTRRPDPGFALIARAWADGAMFGDLPTKAMAPGDFVRVSRQLVDVLRQLKDAVPELAEDTAKTLEMVDRGVVAAQGIG